MHPPLFLLGPSGSGKSDTGHKLVDLFDNHGIPVEFHTSKRWLGQVVLADAAIGKRIGSVIETPNLTLLNPDDADVETFQVVFKNGLALNRAHEALIADVAKRYRETDNNNVMVIAELANGPTISYGKDKEPVRQTGSQFFQWIRQYGLLLEAHCWLITAPLHIRLERNEGRPGRLPSKELEKLYPDSDILPTLELARRMFGRRFHHIENITPGKEMFLGRVENEFYNVLAPQYGLGERMVRPSEQDLGVQSRARRERE